MANYCSNCVVFTADGENLNSIHRLFAEIQEKQGTGENYYLPSFVKSEGGFMTDIVFDKNRISFESRWQPNLETLVDIADFYKASFVCRYSEMMSGLYGEARYESGKLTMVNLDKEDLKQLRYDKRKQGFPCGGEVFEFEGDLLDYLLEQRRLNNPVPPIYIQER